jgi:hypothetical protein
MYFVFVLVYLYMLLRCYMIWLHEKFLLLIVVLVFHFLEDRRRRVDVDVGADGVSVFRLGKGAASMNGCCSC